MLYEKAVSITEHVLLQRFKASPVLEETKHFPYANRVVFDPNSGDVSIYDQQNTEPSMTLSIMAEEHVKTLEVQGEDAKLLVEHALQNMRENYMLLYTAIRMKLWQIDVYFGWDVTRDDRITEISGPFPIDVFGYAAGMGPRIINALNNTLSMHLTEEQMNEIDWILYVSPGAGNPIVNATLARRHSWKAASTPLPPAA